MATTALGLGLAFSVEAEQPRGMPMSQSEEPMAPLPSMPYRAFRGSKPRFLPFRA